MKIEYLNQNRLRTASAILRNGERTISRLAGLFMALFALDGWKMLLAAQHIDVWTGFVRSLPYVCTLALLFLLFLWIVRPVLSDKPIFSVSCMGVLGGIKDFVEAVIVIYVELGFFTYALDKHQQLIYPVVIAVILFLGLICARGILYLLSKVNAIKCFAKEARTAINELCKQLRDKRVKSR